MKENAEKAQQFIEDLMGRIMARLNEIDFHIIGLGQLSSHVAINSSDTLALLKVLKVQLEKTAELGPRLDILQSNEDDLDPSIKKGLEEKDQEISKIVQDLDNILKQMPELADKSDLSIEIKELKKELRSQCSGKWPIGQVPWHR